MSIPVEPASDEAMLLAAVNSFLEQADTKAVHTAFTKQEEDIRMLREAVTGLRETVPRIAEEHKAMREVVATLHATVTALQGSIARCEGLSAGYEKLKGEHHGMQDRHQHLEATVKELRHSTADEFQFDRDVLRSHVVKVEGRMIEVMNRQDDFAAALEHFCHMLQPERDQLYAENAAQETDLVADADRRGRDEGSQRDRAALTSQHGETIKTRVWEGQPDGRNEAAGASIKSPESRQSRWKAAEANVQHQMQAFPLNSPHANKQTALASPTKADERASLVIEHWRAVKRKYSAAHAKNQRKFVWDFIKGFKDPEFKTWFQELLLIELPNDMIRPRAHPSRGPGGEIIALTTKVTWAAVNQVCMTMERPPFF